MAFLKIESSNPNLGYVLRKNPSSGMIAKSCRLGTLFGWFSPEERTLQKYNIFFRDAENEVSYKTNEEENFEYNNLSRYNSSMFLLDAIFGLLDTAVKKEEEHDTPDQHFHRITISALETSTKYVDIFQKSFEEYKLETTEISPGNFEVTITTKKSIRHLLNFTALFGIFNALRTNSMLTYNGGVDEQQVDKYFKCLELLDPPYLIRYVFKINFLRNKKLFQKYKPLLENSTRQKLDFTMGSANEARFALVQSVVGMDTNILDVGCGEGSYVFKFAKKQEEGYTYTAIDTDPECVETVKNKARARELTNVATLSNIDEFLASENKDQPHDVLLVEVIEHMPLQDAGAMLSKLLNKVNVRKLILTTPNKEFSQFYALKDDESRHDDHHFEFNQQEFDVFIKKHVGNYMVTLGAIGDTVDGICPHFACIFEKR